MTESEIMIRLCCRDLPGLRFAEAGMVREPVYLGVQKGRAIEGLVPANEPAVTYELPFTVRQHRDGTPNFLGPYAQGTPAERFIYLCWCVGDDPATLELFRRAKIFLKPLGWETISAASRASGVVEAIISLTDAKGGPLCSTVRASHLTWRL